MTFRSSLASMWRSCAGLSSVSKITRSMSASAQAADSSSSFPLPRYVDGSGAGVLERDAVRPDRPPLPPAPPVRRGIAPTRAAMCTAGDEADDGGAFLGRGSFRGHQPGRIEQNRGEDGIRRDMLARGAPSRSLEVRQVQVRRFRRLDRFKVCRTLLEVGCWKLGVDDRERKRAQPTHPLQAAMRIRSGAPPSLVQRESTPGAARSRRHQTPFECRSPP